MGKDKKKRAEGLTALIYRAKSGDPDSLEELYERFKPIILKMARKMNLEYREDAKHELIAELFEAIQRFKPKSNWGKETLHQHFEKKRKDEHRQ